MAVEPLEAALAVAVVAGVTYATRLVGLLIGGPWAERPAVQEALTVLPACALVGVVVPGLLDGDAVLWLATLATVAVYLRTRAVLAALTAGFALLLGAALLVS